MYYKKSLEHFSRHYIYKRLTCFNVWPVCIIWCRWVYHTPFLQRRNFYWKTINHVMRKIYFTFNFFQFNFLCNGPTSNQVSMILHKMYFISGFLYNYLLFNIVRYMPFELWQWKVNQFFATSIPNITFLSSILPLNIYWMNEKLFYFSPVHVSTSKQ